MSWLLTRRRTLHNVISNWSCEHCDKLIFECILRVLVLDECIFVSVPV